MGNEDLDEFKQRVREELANQLSGKVVTSSSMVESRQYEEFKQVYADPKHSAYEKLCNFAEKLLHMKDPKSEEKYKKDLETCHIDATPSGVISLAALVPMIVVFASLLFGYIIPFALDSSFNNFFFVFIGIIAALAFYPVLIKIPDFLASQWRMSASNQMVLCVFYVVTYMRHTSNLELAIDFAAEHLTPPLALDLKKVIWNVETGDYENVKQSLDAYLDNWKDTNMEFVESMHLIESSLYETTEGRRVNALEKSLDVILSETYEKMLHYAQNLKSPLNMLNMLGIVLPVLGLVILPLAVSFIDGIKWYHIAMIYNVVFPVTILYLSKTILSKRPTGYGQTDISKYDNAIKKQSNIVVKLGKSELFINPIYQSIFIGIVLFLVGISPLLIHTFNSEVDPEFAIGDTAFLLLDYREDPKVDGRIVGPFSMVSAFISFGIPLGLGLGLGMYNKMRTKNIMKIREASKKLELEFASAIFQLGNRIGDGLPLEIAFSKVSDVMQGTISGEFFEFVSNNITRMGMGVEEAIFDKDHGALKYYPSSLIESSMKVMIESAKKGPMIASQSLVNISEYVRQMHRVDERLKDLMADTISSMKSQVSFLAPVIAGIVIGITSMITSILGQLNVQMSEFSGMGSDEVPVELPDLFGLGIPTFFFQAIVGVYIVQIIYILTYLINGIENGNDELSERYMKGNNLIRSMWLYTILGAVVMVVFNYIAKAAMGTLPG